MQRFFVRMVLVVTLLPVVNAQQSSESAFLAALRYVPSDALLLDDMAAIEFASIDAALQLRGLTVPRSWQDMLSNYDQSQVLLSLPPSLPRAMVSYLMVGGPDYGQVLGFDLFDVGSTVSFGQPPSTVTVLTGNLDHASIVPAFEARGYVVEHQLFGSQFLCPEAGCDTGATTNMQARNLANVFGGDLGRQFPVWLYGNAIVGSASETAVRVIAETYIDGHFSVADIDEVIAISGALHQYQYVVSAWLVHPIALLYADLIPIGSSPDSAEEYARGILEALDSNPLPPYSAAAFAAVGDDLYEYGLVTLVYPHQPAAEFAAAALETRLKLFEASRASGTFYEVLSNYGHVVLPTVYAHEDTGLWVVTVGLKAPIPFEPGSGGRHVQAGQPYLRLVSMFINRDTLWLVPSL